MHRMVAFWNAMGERKWRAAHDALQPLEPVPTGMVLEWRPRGA